MFELFVAFILDLFLGDPPYNAHPVRVIGRVIEHTEVWLRSRVTNVRLAGLCQAIFVPMITFIAVWFLCELAFQIHPLLKKILTIYFIYSAVAIKDLEKEARKIYTSLVNRKLEEAKKNLSHIVGRDTQNLDEEEIIRGSVEAVAESFVDGVLSPLFFAAIGSAPLAMTYKAINTLDSMVGNRTPRYKEFGTLAAKLDEIANWIPARLSWILIGIGAAFVNGRAAEAWHTGWKDGADKSFSNSLIPEATFAGALGVQLGGKNYYGGKEVSTPKMGYPMRALRKEDIRTAYHLMKASAWSALFFCMILSYVVWLFYVTIFHPLEV